MKRAFFSVLLTAAMITFTMLSAVSCASPANMRSANAAGQSSPPGGGVSDAGTANDRGAGITDEEVSVATLPELAGLFKDTQKIEVRFDLEQVVWSGLKPVFIEDAKVISDIGDMISQSTVLPDTCEGDMSGMKKSNRMILYHPDGTKSGISFFYDDPCFRKGISGGRREQI
jgi:hypothetical protein